MLTRSKVVDVNDIWKIIILSPHFFSHGRVISSKLHNKEFRSKNSDCCYWML